MQSQSLPARSVESWLASVREAEERGDHLGAYDRAEQGLAAHPQSAPLVHRMLLALARSGATEVAMERLASRGLTGSADPALAALEARLGKDRALASAGAVRRARARDAASLYERVFAATREAYPAINAATMRLVAGDDECARSLASCALASCEGPASQEDEMALYYAEATRAEASLLLDDLEAAREAIARAGSLAGGNRAALTTTRRQLTLICDLKCVDPSVLEPLAAPRFIHYTGHIALTDPDERALAERVAALLRDRRIESGHGALAAGADIVFAEQLLRRRAELHVVLPVDARSFCEFSVANRGEAWVTRYERCLAAASTVTLAARDGDLGDETMFRYGSELAMGMAVLAASQIDASVEQVAAWDGAAPRADAGTAVDVAYWRRHGRSTHVLDVRVEEGSGTERPPGDRADTQPATRVVRALLFADVKGYSKLREHQIPIFVEQILTRTAAVIDDAGRAVVHRNTWGDGLYVVFTDPATAIQVARGLHRIFRSLDLPGLGLPETLGLRVGVHAGPVYQRVDPVIGSLAAFGTHVTRTARIEPITPEGEIYVTEPFAARAALEVPDTRCDYVGLTRAAKDYGAERMYRLRREL